MLNIKNILGLSTYISEIDQLLIHFDHEHPALSASQKREKEKYARIYALRDTPQVQRSTKKLWDKF